MEIKKKTVALSSTGPENMGLTDSAKEAIHQRRSIQEFSTENLYTIVVYNYNMSALELTKNQVFHAGSKHIDIRHRFMREALQNKQLIVRHISTNEMIADLLTKGLNTLKHCTCIEMVGFNFFSYPNEDNHVSSRSVRN